MKEYQKITLTKQYEALFIQIYVVIKIKIAKYEENVVYNVYIKYTYDCIIWVIISTLFKHYTLSISLYKLYTCVYHLFNIPIPSLNVKWNKIEGNRNTLDIINRDWIHKKLR